MKNLGSSKHFTNKNLHYELTKKFFKKNATDNIGYYNIKNQDKLKQNIQKRWMWKIYKKILEDLILSDIEVSNVLDAGCGIGNFTFELSSHKQLNNIIGLDFLKETISVACEKPQYFKKVSFIQGDFLSIPFQNDSFDAVFCLNTLHHIHKNDFERAVHELIRVTKKYIILEIRNKKNIFDFWYNYIVIPLFYKDVPMHTNTIMQVNNIMDKQDFHLINVGGKRGFNWACRRLVLTYKKMNAEEAY